MRKACLEAEEARDTEKKKLFDQGNEAFKREILKKEAEAPEGGKQREAHVQGQEREDEEGGGKREEDSRKEGKAEAQGKAKGKL